MKITFLGVGEAFDNTLPNNAHLLETPTANVMFDCGYSIPQQWFKMNKHPDFLDAIYLSHKHFDHFGGLPPVLMRLWEEKRTKPLTVICQDEHLDFFKGFTETAYRDFPKKFGYQVDFVGVKSRQKLALGNLILSFAPTIHSIENLAVRVENGSKAYCYSGDGQFTPETEKLYEQSDLVIQETYLYDERRLGHACITDTIDMATRLGIKAIACTHMNRDFRKDNLPELRKKLKGEKLNAFIPDPLDEYVI